MELSLQQASNTIKRNQSLDEVTNWTPVGFCHPDGVEEPFSDLAPGPHILRARIFVTGRTQPLAKPDRQCARPPQT